MMGQAQQKRRAVLIVEDDAELRSLTAALFEDEEVDTIECESAEAALATLLIGVRQLARERKRWPDTGRRNHFGSTDAKHPKREGPHKTACASVSQRWATRID